MPMKQEFHKHGTSISLAWNFSFVLMKLYSHASLYFTSLSVFYCSLRPYKISLIIKSLDRLVYVQCMLFPYTLEKCFFHKVYFR